MEAIKKALLETVPVALWVGGTAAATYLITILLDKPEFAQYYGILNVVLVLLNEVKKQRATR